MNCYESVCCISHCELRPRQSAFPTPIQLLCSRYSVIREHFRARSKFRASAKPRERTLALLLLQRGSVWPERPRLQADRGAEARTIQTDSDDDRGLCEIAQR